MKKAISIENEWDYSEDRDLHGVLIIDVESEDEEEQIINKIIKASEELNEIYKIQFVAENREEYLRNRKEANIKFYKTIESLGEYYRFDDPSHIFLPLVELPNNYYD